MECRPARIAIGAFRWSEVSNQDWYQNCINLSACLLPRNHFAAIGGASLAPQHPDHLTEYRFTVASLSLIPSPGPSGIRKTPLSAISGGSVNSNLIGSWATGYSHIM